jgi:hypothetical protein
MENTIENKAKFFAHYWLQEVLIDNIGKKRYVAIQVAAGWCGMNKSYLELKHLSSITDEDALELAKIALYDPSIEEWNADEVWTGEGDMDSLGNHYLEIGMRCWTGVLNINDRTGTITLHDDDGAAKEIYNLSDIFDCLRLKGYAVRWNGLSVEEQVDLGWIKLTE